MKRIICIGGGSLKEKTTLKIDEYIASLAKERAGDKRAYGLFIGTASHDCMPAFNSFRKTYTSNFDIKADCLLLVNVETSNEKIDEKFSKADLIYVGGGDTVYMLEKWKEFGVQQLIIDAYNQGKIICGLSAGAICWFKDMYTDYEIMRGQSSEYVLKKGLGVLDGAMCPHFNEREQDFTTALKKGEINGAYCVENDCAIEFIDGKYNGVISAGGKAYYMSIENGETIKKEL